LFFFVYDLRSAVCVHRVCRLITENLGPFEL